MPTQTLLLVALPNGVAKNGALKASVYVSPKLAGAPNLADFPDWLDWADLIRRKGLKFTFACGGATAEVAAPTGPLRPDLWKEIFKPKTFVAAPQRPDYDK